MNKRLDETGEIIAALGGGAKTARAFIVREKSLTARDEITKPFSCMDGKQDHCK